MEATQIERVRSFNRAVSKRIGALSDDYLDRGRPLGEARLLFEIALEGAEIRSLRERLGLDPGYVSRLIRSLEAQGLVKTAPQVGDARVRVARLTAKGRKEYRAYDASSDLLAQTMLAHLTSGQRERLVGAMNEVTKLLGASNITIASEDPRGADAQWCLARYFEDIAARFEGGYDPTKGLPAGAELFDPPNGFFLIARLEGAPVGCVGLKRRPERTGELKRMWVSSEVRGLGLGRRLLVEIEACARSSGLRRLQLDTNKTLTEARALYVSAGYREIADFNGEPYADHWFEKKL